MKDSKEKSIGGNAFYRWYGRRLYKMSNFFNRRGEKYLQKGAKIIITNPSCKFINPFTLLLSFTVNNNEKYQLIQEGDYKVKYKEFTNRTDLTEDDSPITEDEMMLVIINSHKQWYKKE